MAFVSATQFLGLDVRPFAVEVAKVTLMLGRKLAADELGDERIVLPLADLDANFRTEDAIFAKWPTFDVCMGNRPYLGRRRIVEERGADYSQQLRERYPDIGGVSDYVVYWFRKAHDLLPRGGRAGLVGTNTVRQGDTRKHGLDYIIEHDGVIYDAVASQPWSGDATVEVSIVNWAKGIDPPTKTLWLANGTTRMEVDFIAGSLSPQLDVSKAKKLEVNRSPKVCFQGQTPGDTKGFVLTADEAADIVQRDPLSQNVIYPYLIGDELNRTGQPSRFIIDIDAEDAMKARAMAPAAYERIRRMVLPWPREEGAGGGRSKRQASRSEPSRQSQQTPPRVLSAMVAARISQVGPGAGDRSDPSLHRALSRGSRGQAIGLCFRCAGRSTRRRRAGLRLR